MISLKRLFRSFADAGRGLAQVFKSEQNFRIQIFVGILILIIAAFFPLKVWEIILLVLMILLVLLIEILNTAFEYFSDLFKPRVHPVVRTVKDIMAGAVLLVTIVAVIIGMIILLPHFINLFN